MKQFICITQMMSMTSYAAPSGQRYVSLKNTPFVVSNERDIKFFQENKRFKKVGAFEPALAPELSQDTDEELELIMANINGVSVKTAKKIGDIYQSKEILRDSIFMGEELDTSIPEKHAFKIKEFVLDGGLD